MRSFSPYYPVLLNLEGKRVLVVGGGNTGERKVFGLVGKGARVVVVSPEVTEKLSELEKKGSIEIIRRAFSEDDVEGFSLVYSATSDPEVNRLVSEACRRRGIPVNVVDSPLESSFIVPSVMERGSLIVSVSTSGISPALSRTLRKRIEFLIDGLFPRISSYLKFLKGFRREIMKNISDPAKRRDVLVFLGSEEALSLYEELGENRFKDLVKKRFNL